MTALTVGELQVILSGDMSRLNRDLDRIDNRAAATERQHSAAWSRIGDTAGRAITAGMVLAGGAVVGLGVAIKKGLNMASFTEQAQISFGTLLGSAEAAKAYLGDLQQFAAKTPFELPGVVDAARQLIGVGASAESVIPTLSAWGDASGALGQTQEQFGRTMTAVTQMMGKGKVSAEEMMQVTEAGIPIWALMAKATGKPIGELQKLASEGKLLASDVLPALEQQMQKDYGGSMAKQAMTLSGVWSTAKDNLNLALSDGVQPLAAGLKAVLPDASEAAGRAIREMSLEASEGLLNLIKRGQELHEQFGPEIAQLGEIAAQKWGTFVDLLGELGDEVAPSLPNVVDSLVRIATVGAEVGEAMLPALEAGLSLAGPAADALAGTLGIVANVLETIEPVLPVVVAGFIAFKGVQAATSALGAFQGTIASLSTRLSDTAINAGVFTEKITRSAGAGEKVMTGMGKLGSAVSKVGNSLPLLGVGVVLVGTQMEAASQQTNKWAQALLDGGAAAAQARQEYEESKNKLAGTAIGDWFQSVDEWTGLKSSWDDAKQSAAEMTAEMNPLQRAQQDVTKAANDLASAQEVHGKKSFEAMGAAERLTIAEERLERKQRDVENATRSASAALADQIAQSLAAANSDLMLSNARLGVQDATARYNEVLADGTATAQDRQRVENDLSQSYYNVAGAALKQAEDQATLRGETLSAEDAARIQIDAMQTMATEMGESVPDSVSTLIASLQGAASQADLVTAAAEGVTGAVNAIPGTKDVKVNGLTDEAKEKLRLLGITVTEFPDGHTELHADTGPAQTALDSFIATANRRTATITLFQRIITGQPQPGYGGEAPSGGNPIGLPPVRGPRAKGGPVWPGATFLVGEEGQELFVPDVPGTIINAKQTAAMLAAAGQQAARYSPSVSASSWPSGGSAGGAAALGRTQAPTIIHKHYEFTAKTERPMSDREFADYMRRFDSMYD